MQYEGGSRGWDTHCNKQNRQVARKGASEKEGSNKKGGRYSTEWGIVMAEFESVLLLSLNFLIKEFHSNFG